jgi:hypothetical protein
MKYMKTIKVPETTRQVVEKVECDMCGEEIKPSRNYEVDAVTVQRWHGETYPEGGNTRTQSFDICPKCFVEDLMPYIASKRNMAVSESAADW